MRFYKLLLTLLWPGLLLAQQQQIVKIKDCSNCPVLWQATTTRDVSKYPLTSAGQRLFESAARIGMFDLTLANGAVVKAGTRPPRLPPNPVTVSWISGLQYSYSAGSRSLTIEAAADPVQLMFEQTNGVAFTGGNSDGGGLISGKYYGPGPNPNAGAYSKQWRFGRNTTTLQGGIEPGSLIKITLQNTTTLSTVSFVIAPKDGEYRVNIYTNTSGNITTPGSNTTVTGTPPVATTPSLVLPVYTKVFIIGNSITSHTASTALGWFKNNGMAASAPEYDYVHRFESVLKLQAPAATVKVTGAGSSWENGDAGKYSYLDGQFNYTALISQAFIESYGSDAKADLLVISLTENIDVSKFNEGAYWTGLDKLVQAVPRTASATVILRTSFWEGRDVINTSTKNYCIARGYKLFDLAPIRGKAQYKATGAYGQYSGAVGEHPNDDGHLQINNTLVDALKVTGNSTTPTPTPTPGSGGTTTTPVAINVLSEAESGNAVGSQIFVFNDNAASGGVMRCCFSVPGDYIDYPVTSPGQGTALVKFLYQTNGSAQSEAVLSTNGTTQTVALPGTNGGKNSVSVSLPLVSGANTIRVAGKNGNLFIQDALNITGTLNTGTASTTTGSGTTPTNNGGTTTGGPTTSVGNGQGLYAANSVYQPFGESGGRPGYAIPSWLTNGTMKLGFTPTAGDVVTHFQEGDQQSIANNPQFAEIKSGTSTRVLDLGRQLMDAAYSFPSGSYENGQPLEGHFIDEGQSTGKYHGPGDGSIGWNPVQGGDESYKGRPHPDPNASPVLIHFTDGYKGYYKVQPMQWDLDNVKGKMYMEGWLNWDPNNNRAFRMHRRWTMFRDDPYINEYPTPRRQEAPCFYTTPGLRKYYYCTGQPYTNAPLTEQDVVNNRNLQQQDVFSTEPFIFAVNPDNGKTVCLLAHNARFAFGRFVGQEPGWDNPIALDAGYMQSAPIMSLDHNGTYDFDAALGYFNSLDEARTWAYAQPRWSGLPEYRFDITSQTRHGFWLHHAQDQLEKNMNGSLNVRPILLPRTNNGTDMAFHLPEKWINGRAVKHIYLKAAIVSTTSTFWISWRTSDGSTEYHKTITLDNSGNDAVADIDMSNEPNWNNKDIVQCWFSHAYTGSWPNPANDIWKIKWVSYRNLN